MKFTAHSPQNLFNEKMLKYAQTKLIRPIVRHKIQEDNVDIRADASQIGPEIELRVAVLIPGEDRQTYVCTNEELNAAVDDIADKFERTLRDLSDRKSNRRRKAVNVDFTEELGEDDYLTDGEEDVLRALGALDVVLEV